MPESETERRAGYLVKRVQQALRRGLDSALKETGLSMAQYAVLRALSEHPGASAAELARLCFVTRPSLHDVLRSLRDSGLVVDVDALPRGRARALQLSPSGRRRLSASHAAVTRVEAAMVAGIPAPKRKELDELLLICAENLEALPD
jgi:DNA-binding MarR family transcriptional regulator